MSNQTKNEIYQRGPMLHQGPHPVPDPVKGDIWIDNFDITHMWQGYYWVKVQGGNIEVPTQAVPELLGTFKTHKVYYGGAPPQHAPNTYWITNTREIYDSEVFESVSKKINPNLSGAAYYVANVWEKVQDIHIISSLRGFVAASSLLEVPPEVSLAADKCSKEEAEEKFKAFEEAAELTGRLDVIKDGQERLDILRAGVKEKFNELQKAKGLIAQINEAATYKTLTTASLEEFVKTLYHKP